MKVIKRNGSKFPTAALLYFGLHAVVIEPCCDGMGVFAFSEFAVYTFDDFRLFGVYRRFK